MYYEKVAQLARKSQPRVWVGLVKHEKEPCRKDTFKVDGAGRREGVKMIATKCVKSFLW